MVEKIGTNNYDRKTDDPTGRKRNLHTGNPLWKKEYGIRSSFGRYGVCTYSKQIAGPGIKEICRRSPIVDSGKNESDRKKRESETVDKSYAFG